MSGRFFLLFFNEKVYYYIFFSKIFTKFKNIKRLVNTFIAFQFIFRVKFQYNRLVCHSSLLLLNVLA